MTLGKSFTAWILVSYGDGLEQVPASQKCCDSPRIFEMRYGFVDESMVIALRSWLSLGFVGSWERMLQKMGKSFLGH